MTRYIDADALIEKLEKELEVEPSKSIQTSLIKSVCLLFCKAIELQPTVDLRKVAQDYVSDTTIDAVPTEFVMGNCNLDFICYELTDDGEWCSEHCQYSEPQPECIHRYIDRIWRKEHD